MVLTDEFAKDLGFCQNEKTFSERINMSALNTERLTGDLKRVVRDSEELLEATADAVGDKAREVRKRLSATVEGAKRTCRQLEEKAIDSAKAADKVVRKHPYESIGVALGIGLLIGVLVGRK